MAYGNVVGYEPAASEGVYDFTQADGRKMRMFGPAAEALKARLDASAQLAPQPVAGPGGGGGPNTDSVMFGGSGGDMSVPPPADAGVSVAPPPEPAPAPAPEAPSPPPPPAIAAPDPQADAGMAIANKSLQDAAGALAAQDKAAKGQFVDFAREPDGSVIEVNNVTGQKRIRTPGVAPTKGGIRETTSSLTVGGGYDPNEEYQAHKEELMWRQRAALEVGQEAAENIAAVEKSKNDELSRIAELRSRELEAEQAMRQEKVGELQSKYAQLENDYRTTKIDPDRRNPFARLLDSVAAGMGAFGAAKTGARNFAVDIIQNRIADDIKSQETALNVKREGANNALGQLKTELGSLELAKTALQGIREKQAITHYQGLAAVAQTEKDRAMFLNSAAAMEERYADTMEQYRINAEGQVTKSKNFVNQPGSAGRRAGYDLPTTGQMSAVDKLLEGNKKEGATRTVPAEMMKKITGNALGLETLVEIDQMLGKTKAGPQGEEWDDPAKGPLDTLPTQANLKAKDELVQKTRRLAMAYQDGRGKSDTDAVLASEDAIGSGTIASRKRSVQTAKREFARSLQLELAGLLPDQRAEVMNNLSPTARDVFLEVISEDTKK
jgi:hypothetical protein